MKSPSTSRRKESLRTGDGDEREGMDLLDGFEPSSSIHSSQHQHHHHHNRGHMMPFEVQEGRSTDEEQGERASMVKGHGMMRLARCALCATIFWCAADWRKRAAQAAADDLGRRPKPFKNCMMPACCAMLSCAMLTHINTARCMPSACCRSCCAALLDDGGNADGQGSGGRSPAGQRLLHPDRVRSDRWGMQRETSQSPSPGRDPGLLTFCCRKAA